VPELSFYSFSMCTSVILGNFEISLLATDKELQRIKVCLIWSWYAKDRIVCLESFGFILSKQLLIKSTHLQHHGWYFKGSAKRLT
jgi:hypothetical protein